MKYGIFRSRGILPPWEEDVEIYLAPVSEQPDRYQALTPRSLHKGGEFTLLRQSFHIKTYENCPDSSIDKVKDGLSSEFKARAEKFASRMRLFFSTGIIAAVLGFLNIFVPDPLPFLDEAILLIGGGLVAALGSYALKRQVKPYRNCMNGIIENIRTADVTPDPVLSMIYRAIHFRAHPELLLEGEEDMADDIELESAWLVKHLNIPELLQTEALNTTQFFAVMRALTRSFNAGLFLNPALQKTRRYRKHIEKLGLDDDAVAVYEELFSRARDIFTQYGDKFP